MREPVFLVDRFVQHYRALGANKVVIYWDGVPNPEKQSQLRALAPAGFLQLIYCDDAFWASHGLEKANMMLDDVQEFCLTLEYGRCDTEWMLICDADEFLHSPVRPMPEFLADAPTEGRSLRIRHMEAFWGPDDTLSEPLGCSYFRERYLLGPLTQPLTRLLYGQYSVFSNRGMIGHNGGKYLLRCGLEHVTIGTTLAWIDGKDIGTWAHALPKPDSRMFFAHYDAVSEERWVEKWRRRISNERPSDKMGPTRVRQQQLIKDAMEQGDTRSVFKALYGVNAFQVAVLKGLRKLERVKPILGADAAFPAPVASSRPVARAEQAQFPAE